MKWIGGLVVICACLWAGWGTGRSYQRYLYEHDRKLRSQQAAEAEAKVARSPLKPGEFDAADWLDKRAAKRQGLPQFRDVYLKLPYNLPDNTYESIRYDFFHDVLWPEMLKREIAASGQYASTLEGFLQETKRPRR